MAGRWSRTAMGFAIAAVVSWGAYRRRALSASGALAATAVGGVTVVGAGFRGGTALAAFFISSTMLGRFPSPRRPEQNRGNRRDAVQVLANGGIAAGLALFTRATTSHRPALLIGFAGAVAAATADTWATEIGSRSRQRPRSIVTLKRVPLGASGGVTAAGLAAAAVGTATIAAVMSAGSARCATTRGLTIAITLGGFTGALVDSVLGATVQEVRFCDFCQQETERRVHHCGQRTYPIRGASWCTNDVVNAWATASGATAAMGLFASVRHRHRS